MAKQQLTQEQKQKLNIRHLQQIGILALPLEALEQRIKEELARNPALESDGPQPEVDPAEQRHEEDERHDLLPEERDEDYYDDPTYQYYNENDAESFHQTNYTGDRDLLSDYLREQLPSLNLNEREAAVAELVVGNIAEDGYLRATNREIADWLLFNDFPEVGDKEIEAVIRKVQTLDPPGVAGRDLREVLLLQIDRLNPSDAVEAARILVEKYFEDFAMKRFAKISEASGLSEERLADAVALIQTLNPKPGNGFGSDFDAVANRIVPDFIVRADGENITVSLNDDYLPSLRVAPAYKELSAEQLSQNRKKRAEQQYVRKQVADAIWFINMVSCRRNTLLQTMESVVSMQEDYFRSGDLRDMKPLILKDIADRVGFDVSTISRISNEKYVETDFGVYPLKHFFSEGVCANDGTMVATRYVKHLITELIAEENKQAPLTDDALTRQLDALGYPLSRRTVAKYREKMLIPSARRRKTPE